MSPFFVGARMLRQEPLECLFSFICSSNNHISRIHGMVERLCSTYGTSLGACGRDRASQREKGKWVPNKPCLCWKTVAAAKT